jgi:hypothetical protein
VSPAEIETGMARLAPLLAGAPAPTASV